jgi:transcriptional regulator with XRE-family HTH domain
MQTGRQPKSEYKEIAERILKFKSGRGWSNAEFARRVGIYPQDVQSYLRGLFNPANLLLRLFQEGCDVIWLLTGKDHSARTREEAEVLAHLSSVGISDRESLARLIEKARLFDEIMEGPVGQGTIRELVKSALDRKS